MPVIAVAGYDAPVGEEQPDLATATRRRGELTDAGERAATARRQMASAEDHAVEAMGSALLDLVRGV